MLRITHAILGALLMVAVGSPAEATNQRPAALSSIAAQNQCTQRAIEVDRLSGADRYTTAVAVSSNWSNNQAVVFVVNGNSYPDAVSAAGRAGTVHAPVLLTGATRLPTATALELKRLRPNRIVVVGGGRAVSSSVAKQMRQYSPGSTVERVAGANRYATAAKMAAKYPSGLRTAYLASGEDFPDALAGSALAGYQGFPLLLTRAKVLDTAAIERLKSLNVGQIVVLGGTGAVSSTVAKQSASYTRSGEYSRIAGADRYATAAKVGEQFGRSSEQVFVASGEQFPDALVGAALAGRRGVPLILTTAAALPAHTQNALKYHGPAKIHVLGGWSVISSSVLRALGGYAGPADSCQPLLGGYLGSPNESPDRRFRESFGAYPDLASTYYQADGRKGGKLNTSYERERISRGTIPVITVTSSRGPHTMQEIGSGDADKWIDYWAKQLASLDSEVWFTFDHEFEVKLNQGKFPAGTTYKQYVRAFNRFQSHVTARAPKVKFLYWYGYHDKNAINNVGAGIDPPDIIALDPYVFAHRNPGVSFEQMLEPKVDWLKGRSWYRGQPIVLGEFAKDLSFGDQSVAKFLYNLRPRLAKLGVSGALYFSRDKGGDIYADITNSRWPEARASYRASVLD